MPKKPKTPPSDPTVVTIRRPKKAVEPEPTPPVPDDEVEVVAEMTAQLRAVVETIPDEVRATITGLLANQKNLTACRKFQEAANEAGAPELSRPEQRACCIAIAQAFVLPADFVPDDSVGEDDTYEVKAPPPPPKLTGKVLLGKRKMDKPCPINETQFAEFALALAKCEQESRDLDQAHKAMRSRMKEQKDDSNANRARLAGIVSERVEVRAVTVCIEADYDLGVVREIDEASGDVLETRPMKAEELQVPLPFTGLVEKPVEEVAPESDCGSGNEGGRTLEVIEGGKGDDETEDDGSPE